MLKRISDKIQITGINLESTHKAILEKKAADFIRKNNIPELKINIEKMQSRFSINLKTPLPGSHSKERHLAATGRHTDFGTAIDDALKILDLVLDQYKNIEPLVDLGL